jgi:isopropylmalate/homocitrate/citramalate synthase
MYPLSKFLREISGLTVRQNQGIIGDNISKIESGIVAGWYHNAKDIAPLELSPYLYSLTGHPDTEVVLGKHSGLITVDMYLDRLDMKASDPQKLEILTRLKEYSHTKHGLLTIEEFAEIATRIIGKG